MKQLRLILLKTMLWALGFGALVGVAAILMGGEDVVMRVMISAFVTAAAALLMIPVSFVVDRRSTQATGLFLLAAIVTEYLIWMAFTWVVDTRLPYSIEIRTGVTGLWLLLAILPLAVSIRLVSSERGRIAGWCSLGVCCASLVLAMLGTWAPGGWPDEEEWWSTMAAVFAYGGLAAACLVRPGTGARYLWRWMGPPFATAGLALALAGIWLRPEHGAQLFVAVTGAAVVVAHANLMLLVPLRPGQRWLLVGTIGAAIVSVLLLDLTVMLSEAGFGSPELVARPAGAAGILACCGSLAMLVLARINRRVDFQPLKDMPLAVTVICPRCRRKAKVPLGGGSCATCALRIEVNVEEPSCSQCGYLLYRLASNVCPECGTPSRPPGRGSRRRSAAPASPHAD